MPSLNISREPFMPLSSKKLNQIALLSVSLVATAGASTLMTSPVLAFGFQQTGDIKVFDTTGNQIGSGTFDSVSFEGHFARVVPGGVIYVNPSTPPPGPSVLSTYTPPPGVSMLTSFNVNMNLGGTNFNLSRVSPVLNTTGQSFNDLFLMGPPDPSQTSTANSLLTVSPGDPRSPNITPRDNQWFSCVPACGITQRQVYSFNENGTWSLFGPSVGGGATAPAGAAAISAVGAPISVGGRFEISTRRSTSAPEPTTLLGTALAVGAGLLAKKRLGRQVAQTRRQAQTQQDVA
jgi:hypothetical protein